MKALVVALIAAGLVVPSFALMEQDQPKQERKKNEIAFPRRPCP